MDTKVQIRIKSIPQLEREIQRYPQAWMAYQEIRGLLEHDLRLARYLKELANLLYMWHSDNV